MIWLQHATASKGQLVKWCHLHIRRQKTALNIFFKTKAAAEPFLSLSSLAKHPPTPIPLSILLLLSLFPTSVLPSLPDSSLSHSRLLPSPPSYPPLFYSLFYPFTSLLSLSLFYLPLHLSIPIQILSFLFTNLISPTISQPPLLYPSPLPHLLHPFPFLLSPSSSHPHHLYPSPNTTYRAFSLLCRRWLVWFGVFGCRLRNNGDLVIDFQRRLSGP